MGVKTWVLLPLAADWRWELGGTRAPWYPATRLFRQSKAGDWDPVFAELRLALETMKRISTHAR
jgi:hypothetical protein